MRIWKRRFLLFFRISLVFVIYYGIRSYYDSRYDSLIGSQTNFNLVKFTLLQSKDFVFSRTRKSGLLEKSLDDSQHIFPIDLSEGQHKKPSPPENNSKNRHENEPNEDTKHLKFFPNRENEENKNSPENKEHKKSKNNNHETQERSDDPDKSSSLDVKPIKPKNQDWHSGLVLGETDIIKKLYSSVPEAKVYEVGNSIGRL